MATNEPKIIILIPYFGTWPFWIPFFLLSCRLNPTINWLIYTDCSDIENCPQNVRIIRISFIEYCDKVSQKLGITFKPKNAYKLCDIKPALGMVHDDDIQQYDFWAFGDIDLIYGNLRDFFTPERLSKKDIFSNSARRISGHLCFIRNTPHQRSAFKKIDNWQQKFENQQHLALDEKEFTKIFLRYKNAPSFVKKIAGWLDPMLKNAEFKESYNTPHARYDWIDGIKNYPTQWYWKRGQLTNNLNGDRSFAYFHFMVWKKNWAYTTVYKNVSTTDQFLINEQGFFIDGIKTSN